MKTIVSSFLCAVAIAAITSCGGGSGTSGNTDSSAMAADSNATTGSTAGFKLGVQMWTFNHFTFTDALAKVDSAGIKYIEAFWGQKLGGGLPGSFGPEMNTDTRTKLKKMLDDKGIQMLAMGVIAPNGKADWIKAFDLAKFFGLSYITCEPIKTQWDLCDSLAGAYGIKLAIHDHPNDPNHNHMHPYGTPDSVLEAVKGHPNIGACADVGHWARNGVNPVEGLKKLEGHVFGVHLKDIVKFGDPYAADTAVGHGVNDFPAIFAELKRQNFNGMLSIEQESNWWHNLTDVIATKKMYDDEIAKLNK
ncbi:MAG TPA: sugar phosphate isomerase/epimerase [Chitinophagaceae bacterium]|nr:sugar phosphate isomerase/epimerase [Chitinophagaceae bacterium]